MKMIWLPICSAIIGLLLGLGFTITLPTAIAKYLSIAILAALDSVLGGVRAIMQDTFDGAVMLTGFFTNALFAAGLAFLGDQIGVDIYLAATVCFGLRLFSNLGYIRRYLVQLYYDHREAKANKKLKNNPSAVNNVLQEIESHVDKMLNIITQDELPDQHQYEAPLKIKAIEKSKTGDDFIQEFYDEDIIEYTKVRDHKNHKE